MDLQDLTEWITLLRDRISPTTVISAVTAAAGVAILLLGLLSIRRESLADEAQRISGIRSPSWMARWQMRLYQTGLRIRLWEFVLIGCLLGLVGGAVMLLMGFTAIGLLVVPAGPVVYFQWLMQRRRRELRRFQAELPDAIDDFLQALATTRNVAASVKVLAERGPLALRPEFAEVHSLILRQTPVDAALEAVGQARAETFFRQFMDALAQHELNGGDLRSILERIAQAQRAQLRLHDKIAAQQSGAKFIGWVYAIAPLAFLLFTRAVGGAVYGSFYDSMTGQLMQVFVALSGLASWWLTNKIAQRGIYVHDHTAPPALNVAVRQTGFPKAIAQGQ